MNGPNPTVGGVMALLVVAFAVWFQWCAPCGCHAADSLKDAPLRCVDK